MCESGLWHRTSDLSVVSMIIWIPTKSGKILQTSCLKTCTRANSLSLSLSHTHTHTHTYTHTYISLFGWLVDFMVCQHLLVYLMSTSAFLIQIICTQSYGFKYSCLIRILCTHFNQLYGFQSLIIFIAPVIVLNTNNFQTDLIGP